MCSLLNSLPNHNENNVLRKEFTWRNPYLHPSIETIYCKEISRLIIDDMRDDELSIVLQIIVP